MKKDDEQGGTPPGEKDKFAIIWRSARRPISVIAFGVVLYEILEHLSAVSKAVNGFFTLLTPVFIAIAIAFLANMPMRFLENRVFAKWNKNHLSLKRGVCLALAMLFVFAIVAAVLLLIIPKAAESITTLANGFDGYIAGLTSWATSIWQKVDLSPNVEQIISEFVQDLLSYMGEYVTSAAQSIVRFTFSVVAFVVDLLLAVIISVYALYNKEKLIMQFKRLVIAVFNEKTAKAVLDICSRANKTLNRYIYGMIIECTILGVLTFIAMQIFSMPYSVLISVIVGVTQMVPIIGPWCSGAVGALIILVTDPPMTVWFIVMLLVVQQLEANVFYPRVVGNAVGLSGIWVMIAVILGGGLFGVGGIILCVPVMAVLYTLISEWVNRRVENKRYMLGMRDNPPTEEEIRSMTDIKKQK
jgi:predicted PurR-regulated permease PerM